MLADIRHWPILAFNPNNLCRGGNHSYLAGGRIVTDGTQLRVANQTIHIVDKPERDPGALESRCNDGSRALAEGSRNPGLQIRPVSDPR